MHVPCSSGAIQVYAPPGAKKRAAAAASCRKGSWLLWSGPPPPRYARHAQAEGQSKFMHLLAPKRAAAAASCREGSWLLWSGLPLPQYARPAQRRGNLSLCASWCQKEQWAWLPAARDPACSGLGPLLFDSTSSAEEGRSKFMCLLVPKRAVAAASCREGSWLLCSGPPPPRYARPVQQRGDLSLCASWNQKEQRLRLPAARDPGCYGLGPLLLDMRVPRIGGAI
ncbi:hypothetical protein NDU88_007945 [Pleurodeles waltl]|uniref:Uncharacterized protein n=1 Tax=Pleurodeles waltl TaxID=8319 RepID=A0AAV7N3J4_PLEWA|nr:hypothetical protein NDU88_007945 [Pleurodeles waltl]